METLKEGFQLIVTIVEQGFAQDIINAVRASGGEGGTIIPARGSGIHEHATFFGVTIEPQKELVLTLVKRSVVDNVLKGISEAVDIEKPGNGIAFVLDVPSVIGINHMHVPKSKL